MICISGLRTTIAAEFLRLTPEDEDVYHLKPGSGVPGRHGNRYLIAQGLLYGKSLGEHTFETTQYTWEVNFALIGALLDRVFAEDSAARVVVIGSESGYAGSYDMAYAGAKAALHLYVERKALKPHQQLVAISPGIIGDAGMTKRRLDVGTLEKRRAAHPKQRFLEAAEVARMAHFLLYVDQGYTSGTVIRMNGGENAWR